MVIIPTSEIQKAGDNLIEISNRISGLLSRANSISSGISKCYMRGGVGNRAFEATSRMREESALSNRKGKVLYTAVKIYENKEQQLEGQSKSTADTIENGYNVSWTQLPFIKAILSVGSKTMYSVSTPLGVLATIGVSYLIKSGGQGKPNPVVNEPVPTPEEQKEAEAIAKSMHRDEYRSKVDVPLYGQKTGYTCGSASGSMILNSLGVETSESQFWNYADQNTDNLGTYVYRIKDTLNHYYGENVYSYRTTAKLSTEEYYSVISKSLDAGYPVEVVLKINEKDYFGYKTNGHYVVITEVYMNENDEYMARINDPYSKSGVNHPQTVDIPLSTLHQYNKAHSSYIIYHKVD